MGLHVYQRIKSVSYALIRVIVLTVSKTEIKLA